MCVGVVNSILGWRLNKKTKKSMRILCTSNSLDKHFYAGVKVKDDLTKSSIQKNLYDFR